MPMYNFHCKKCGEVFEELVKFDAPAPKCAKCGSKNVERTFDNQNVSAHYRGSGFHVNDYPSVKRQRDKINYLSSDD